jgi:hypothetical protein
MGLPARSFIVRLVLLPGTEQLAWFLMTHLSSLDVTFGAAGGSIQKGMNHESLSKRYVIRHESRGHSCASTMNTLRTCSLRGPSGAGTGLAARACLRGSTDAQAAAWL